MAALCADLVEDFVYILSSFESLSLIVGDDTSAWFLCEHILPRQVFHLKSSGAKFLRECALH